VDTYVFWTLGIGCSADGATGVIPGVVEGDEVWILVWGGGDFEWAVDGFEVEVCRVNGVGLHVFAI